MKAILSYENYQSFGKQYQVKFIYENESEIEEIAIFIKKMKEKHLIKPYYQSQSRLPNNYSNIKIIGGTNIPKNILLSFINMLITLTNATVSIGNEEYTTFEQSTIEKTIEKLHTNATLSKGEYLGLGTQYYITFKYANVQQKEEILYEFIQRLYPTIGINSIRSQEKKEFIMPFLIDNLGNLSLEFTGIIGGTNIPKDLLPEILKILVEQHDVILKIGNKQFKGNINEEELLKAIANIKDDKPIKANAPLKQGRSRKKQKPKPVHI